MSESPRKADQKLRAAFGWSLQDLKNVFSRVFEKVPRLGVIGLVFGFGRL